MACQIFFFFSRKRRNRNSNGDGGSDVPPSHPCPPLRAAKRGTGGEDHVERGTGGEAPNPSPRSETERGSPRRAASPRSSRPRAAPSAAETVTSKRASSEWPARCNAPRSSSVTV